MALRRRHREPNVQVMPSALASLRVAIARAANPMAVVDGDGRTVIANPAWQALADGAGIAADPAASGALVDAVPDLPGHRLLSLERRALPRPPQPAEADLRRVLDTLDTAIALTTPAGVVIDVNQAPLAALGLRRDEVVGRPIGQLGPFRDHPAARDVLAAAVATAAGGSAWRGDLELRARGRAVVLDVQVVPVRDEGGTVSHLVAAVVDVTERRTIEADLRDREERLRATFDVVAVGLAHVAPDGRWVRVNDRLCRILGYERDELLAGRFADITHPDDLTVDLALAGQVLEGTRDSYVIEKRYLRRDASVVWAELHVSLVRDPGGRPAYFVAAISDISRRREAESTIRRQLAEIEALFQTTPMGLAVLDTELRFVRVNDRLAEMNGVPAAAHIGRSVREIVPAVADQAEPLLRRVLDTGEPVSGIEVSGETPAHPGIIRTWLETWVPIRSPRDEVIGISATVEEITERRRVEQLRDTFIGMLSHELRTPITSLYAASQLLRRNLAAGIHADADVRADLLEEVMAGTERLQRIVENLLVLARVERGVALPGEDPVLLQRVLPTVVSAERVQWPQHRLVLAPLPPDLPPVRSDADALAQVVRNLVSNAAKYGPPTGTIEVVVEPPGPGTVCLAVCDEGPGLGGVDPERLFDLYYRAAEASRRAAGAGIGLFVCRALVEAMGGTLRAADRPGGGAEFRVCLPVFTED
jgi:PAS domain S-box-containing protein